MTKEADDVLRAALLLRRDARDLRLSHTVRGKWPDPITDPCDRAAKADWEELTALANRLTEIAERVLG